MSQDFSSEHAAELDQQDELKAFRNRFRIPTLQGKEAIYFCGNSLGLQPKSVADSIQVELDDWAQLGVEGHVHGRRPWLSYHEQFAAPLARLTGARETEVVAMNGLTVNLHLLMVSFFRPTSTRYRIICEEKAFPSDSYALNSQAALHGLSPEDVIREISPRPGQAHIELSDVLEAIAEEGDRLAMVMIGGVNYYSGQVFDMSAITQAGHAVGAMVGFDLAHAIGNIELKLHDWEVDFAAWCSYKYLNSGPGSVAGIYIHEKHASNPNTFRLAGWWGHDKASRFKMEPGFNPIPTAESWQMSNAPVLSMAAHKASLDLFDEAGMPALIAKSKKLTSFLNKLLIEVQQLPGFEGMFSIITPQERGCQLSLLFHREGKAVFDHLFEQGIIADWREPNVIRIAPVPLYNSFMDAYQFSYMLSTYQSK
jgi:kynureninase